MSGSSSEIDSTGGRPGSCPLISVVMPTKDARKYLTACLESITGQAFRDIEIIAIDGASRDGTAELLDDFGRTEPRLLVRHEKRRIGPGNARNLGAKLAHGEYLWFVDGDDVIT